MLLNKKINQDGTVEIDIDLNVDELHGGINQKVKKIKIWVDDGAKRIFNLDEMNEYEVLYSIK